MAEYEQSMAMAASPEAIFDFVSDIENLPKYLPTTKSAQPQGEGSLVTVHISLRGAMDSEDGPPEAQIQEGLATALLSIQNFVEGGKGGEKVQPSAETS